MLSFVDVYAMSGLYVWEVEWWYLTANSMIDVLNSVLLFF